MALECANCESALQPLDCGGVVVDRCRRCAGIWFDEGELRFFRDGLERRLLESLTVRAQPAVVVHATTLPCPRCRLRLVHGEFAYGTGVRVARCSHCEGVWLPGSEVARFVEHVRTARQKRAETREIAEAVAEGTNAQLERHHPLRHSSFRHPFPLATPLFWLPAAAESAGDEPARATTLLLLSQLLVQLFLPRDVALHLALVPDALGSPLAWGSLVGASFVHGGWLHFLGNALFLAVFGRALEGTLGSWRFAALYFATDFAASIAYLASVGLDSTTPCLGASGAVSGVLGAYLVLHPTARVTTLYPWSSHRVSAWLYLGGWFLLQLVGLARSTAADTVAFSAHVGGFVAGALLGWRCRRAER